MTILAPHTQRIIFHKVMASAHLIAAEYDCAVSDVLDLLVTAPFTPSEPQSAIPAGQARAAGLYAAVQPSLPGAEGAADREQITPSQPGETSRSHAPAADTPVPVAGVQTDGAAEPPVPTEPSVDLSGLAAHEQGPQEQSPSDQNERACK